MGLLARARFGFEDKLSSNDAVGMRVTRLEGTYIVVRFKALRAADGVKSWTSPAELAESLWTGTVAASADEAKHMITTVNSTMKRKCIINCGFENASLSECGENGFLVGEHCLRHSGHLCGLMAHSRTANDLDAKTVREDRTGRTRARDLTTRS